MALVVSRVQIATVTHDLPVRSVARELLADEIFIVDLERLFLKREQFKFKTKRAKHDIRDADTTTPGLRGVVAAALQSAAAEERRAR